MKEIGISEAARKYGLSPASVRFWIKNKTVQAEKKTINNSKVPQYRIKVASLEKWLKETGHAPVRKTIVPEQSTPIGQKVFDFVQRHPERFESMTLGEINELIQELNQK